MKKILSFLFILSLSISNICFSQSGWFWQNPLPQGNRLNSIKFLDDSVAIAVGDMGTVIKTTNGGLNWFTLPFTNYKVLRCVNSLGNNSLFICGDSGLVFKSTNSGISWQSLNSKTNYNLNAISFVNDSIGFIVGDNCTILKTNDRGLNWDSVNYSIATSLYSVFFVNSQTGYLGGSTYILKTVNGGFNWSIVGTYSNCGFRSFLFFNSDTGYTVGYHSGFIPSGIFYKTTNGGINWIESSITGTGCYSLQFKNLNTGFVTAYYGVVSTTNGGINWVNFTSSQDYSLIASDIAFGNTAFAVGNGGNILKTTSFGMNWISVSNLFPGLSNNDIFFCNENTGYVCDAAGNSVILKTTNGGSNWYMTEGPQGTLFSIFFTSNDTGYTVGGTNIVYKTTNGGINWNAQQTNSADGFRVVYFINQLTGVVGGYHSCIYRTTNGGMNWDLKNTEYTGTIGSISFANEFTGYAVNAWLGMIKTTNGGNNWFYISSISSSRVFFINPNTGFAISGNKILKTSNSGLSWDQVLLTNVILNISDVRLTNNGVGYAVCDNGKIFKTFNYGSNWYQQQSITENSLYALCVINDQVVYCVGKYKIIIKTTNGGGMIIGINNEHYNRPSSFSLSQNYPNPFNPVTKIKYDIPPSKGARGMMTKLIIYDILGREIETLVNETQKPGSYEVTWDGSRFASGVYFYKLYIDDASAPLSITKKMVLIK
jgi:photosystem II stability/assembly factor-like uncharacterized protein